MPELARALGLAGRALAALLAATALARAETAPDRIAVVVGNQDYEKVADLSNARADAQSMSEMLRAKGFVVFDAYDVDRQGFEHVMRQAILNADEGSEIVFFYAGHGIQIGRRNYLLPTDVAFESVYDLPVQSMTLDRVIEQLSARGTVHVAIIDACRDNPFPDRLLAGDLDASLFETKSGFDVFRTPLNSLVAFSTSPGLTAFDGEQGGNSPYTAAILRAVEERPETDAISLFARVRERVYEATAGEQVPWESSTLTRPFHFVRASAQREDPGAVAQARAAPPAAPAAAAKLAALPGEVTLEADYDRRIPLGTALSDALGLAGPVPITVVRAPAGGAVAAADDGLVYVPELSERRSAGGAATLSDSFVARVGEGPEAADITVSLDMPVNACDLEAGDALDPGGVGFYRLPNEIDIRAALAACAEAARERPDAPRFQHQLGRAQQAAGRYEEAHARFERAAGMGHVRAKNAVALLLSSDLLDRDIFDIPADSARALELLEEGVGAGDPFSMHTYGRHLLREGETAAERERGFELLDRAAELGHTYSMNELGTYFLTKDTGHFLPERGMRYLEASAARDDIYGYHNLGFVALFGLEAGEPDHATARAWFERAALGGHPRSPSTLGRMVVRGQVPGATPADAARWYDMGLARGDPWGGVNAAEMMLRGEVPGRDGADALVRAAKAANLSGEEPAARAARIVADAAPSDLGRAIQLLLNELGEAVTVDGAVGPFSRAAIARVMEAHGLPAPPDERRAQLVALGKAYWAENPLRSDLF